MLALWSLDWPGHESELDSYLPHVWCTCPHSIKWQMLLCLACTVCQTVTKYCQNPTKFYLLPYFRLHNFKMTKDLEKSFCWSIEQVFTSYSVAKVKPNFAHTVLYLAHKKCAVKSLDKTTSMHYGMRCRLWISWLTIYGMQFRFMVYTCCS